jgi:hypothetical protein
VETILAHLLHNRALLKEWSVKGPRVYALKPPAAGDSASREETLQLPSGLWDFLRRADWLDLYNLRDKSTHFKNRHMIHALLELRSKPGNAIEDRDTVLLIQYLGDHIRKNSLITIRPDKVELFTKKALRGLINHWEVTKKTKGMDPPVEGKEKLALAWLQSGVSPDEIRQKLPPEWLTKTKHADPSIIQWFFDQAPHVKSTLELAVWMDLPYLAQFTSNCATSEGSPSLSGPRASSEKRTFKKPPAGAVLPRTPASPTAGRKQQRQATKDLIGLLSSWQVALAGLDLGKEDAQRLHNFLLTTYNQWFPRLVSLRFMRKTHAKLFGELNSALVELDPAHVGDKTRACARKFKAAVDAFLAALLAHRSLSKSRAPSKPPAPPPISAEVAAPATQGTKASQAPAPGRERNALPIPTKGFRGRGASLSMDDLRLGFAGAAAWDKVIPGLLNGTIYYTSDLDKLKGMLTELKIHPGLKESERDLYFLDRRDADHPGLHLIDQNLRSRLLSPQDYLKKYSAFAVRYVKIGGQGHFVVMPIQDALQLIVELNLEAKTPKMVFSADGSLKRLSDAIGTALNHLDQTLETFTAAVQKKYRRARSLRFEIRDHDLPEEVFDSEEGQILIVLDKEGNDQPNILLSKVTKALINILEGPGETNTLPPFIAKMTPAIGVFALKKVMQTLESVQTLNAMQGLDRPQIFTELLTELMAHMENDHLDPQRAVKAAQSARQGSWLAREGNRQWLISKIAAIMSGSLSPQKAPWLYDRVPGGYVERQALPIQRTVPPTAAMPLAHDVRDVDGHLVTDRTFPEKKLFVPSGGYVLDAQSDMPVQVGFRLWNPRDPVQRTWKNAGRTARVLVMTRVGRPSELEGYLIFRAKGKGLFLTEMRASPVNRFLYAGPGRVRKLKRVGTVLLLAAGATACRTPGLQGIMEGLPEPIDPLTSQKDLEDFYKKVNFFVGMTGAAFGPKQWDRAVEEGSKRGYGIAAAAAPPAQSEPGGFTVRSPILLGIGLAAWLIGWRSGEAWAVITGGAVPLGALFIWMLPQATRRWLHHSFQWSVNIVKRSTLRPFRLLQTAA